MVYRFHATNLTGLSLLTVQLSLHKAKTVLWISFLDLFSLSVCEMSHTTTKLLKGLSYTAKRQPCHVMTYLQDMYFKGVDIS